VINSADVGKVGSGTAQLTAYKDGAVAKSIIFTTITLTSMGTTDAPDPVQIYIDRIVRAGQEAVNAAADAEESAEEAASSAEAAAGSAEAAADSAASAQQILDDIPNTVEAELAAAKQSGEFDGSKIYGGALVTINRENVGGVDQVYVLQNSAPNAKVGDYIVGHMSVGNTMYMFQVSYVGGGYINGLASSLFQISGPTGSPGAPGYSPTVTVTDITGGHRVTITDASGAHTFDVMDGQGGSGGSSNVLGGYNVSIELIQISDGAGGWIDAYYVDASSVPGVQVGDWIVGNNNPGLAMFRVEGFDSGDPYGTSLVILRRDIIPAGGTTGQVLRKKSDSDYDVEWATI
jgi:hypothetical protein